jgi:two-component system nitrogen regulation sensor histidine kinase NtrY
MTQLKAYRKNIFPLLFSLFILFVTSWLMLFLQKKQNIIGGGIDRVIFFLLINVHIIIIIALFYVIVRRTVKLFLECKQQTPGSRFKRNVLFALTIFSVLPTFFVFFIAGKLITTNIDDWFNARIGTGLTHAQKLHDEQTANLKKQLKNDGNMFFSIATKQKFLSKIKPNKLINKIEKEITTNFKNRNYTFYIWKHLDKPFLGSIIDEIATWRSYRKVNDRSMGSLKRKFLSKLETTNDAHVFDFYGSAYWAKRTTITLPKTHISIPLTFVIAHRYPPPIRYSLIELQTSIHDYEQLKSMRNPIYWHYFIIFIFATLLILLLSIWCAFYLAKGITKPISELIAATETVRGGKWNVQVTLNPTSDLNQLAVGFNEMTKALRYARLQLENNNKEMLLIFEHINASVFLVNAYGRIIMFNAAARKLTHSFLNISRFKNKKVNFFGRELTGLFFSLVRQLKNSGKNQLTKEITFSHKANSKTFMAHLSSIDTTLKGEGKGLLVVIEDLTDIVKISKIKTWQEAARQMAHEIKNPLTPIQLATQRLRRRYKKVTTEDDAIFSECTDTILSHVNIIRNLVANFSQFAKMPESNAESLDINTIVKEVACLYQVSYPEIMFDYNLQNFLPSITIDKKKIKRVLVNLLDNSVRVLMQQESIPASTRIVSEQKKQLKIKTNFKTRRNQIELLIADNGPGIPGVVRDRLFLPHVSGEKKNMGLGLAIVHEIITQMGGTVKLLPSKQGATFQILLPI